MKKGKPECRVHMSNSFCKMQLEPNTFLKCHWNCDIPREKSCRLRRKCTWANVSRI